MTPGVHFFDLVTAANLPRVDSASSGRGGTRPSPGGTTATSSDSLPALRRKFEELYAPSHPLRAALQKLHALEPVKIIEGKA